MKINIGFLVFLCATVTALAGGTVLQGIVKDAGGHPIKDAEIKIEPRSGAYFSKIVKTDANGHYVSSGLPVGVYKVTLTVNGAVKASLLNTSTNPNKPTDLSFNLSNVKRPVKTHLVWVPPEIGTHIGNGRWVEVDENGNVVDGSIQGNVDRINSAGVQQMQRSGLGSKSPTGQ